MNQNTTSDDGNDATCCFDIKDIRYDVVNSIPLSQNAASLDSGECTSSMTDVLEALTELFLKSTTETRLYFQVIHYLPAVQVNLREVICFKLLNVLYLRVLCCLVVITVSLKQ